MPTATIDIPALVGDGYLDNTGGIPTAINGTTTLKSGSSSSLSSTQQQIILPFNVLAGLASLPGNATITAVDLIVNATSRAIIGDENIIGAVCSNGCAGATTDTFDWDLMLTQRRFYQGPIPTVGQVTFPLLVSDLNLSGITDIGFLFSNGSEFGATFWIIKAFESGDPAILRVTYTTPAPSATPANDVRQKLSALLAARLNTISVFHGRVYEYEPSSFIEYPTCAVISTGFFDDVVSQIYNVRDYQFTIVAWVNLGKGKPFHGRKVIEDAIFAVLDNYQDFGGNVLWSKPQTAGWGESVDPAIAYLMINIEARKQRLMSFS